ncbi:ABC transporter permease [Yinghuangia sp. ASG 101]|uniref:ABC transporter permease n=1 Tax=Yinghuangia sp. ASG 101 TaxID=2896848 RepID=UPI001E390C77|nr:ABC transporter permease [Yinghuangia sp. ASG 101]UGQ12199.1 ABC transporter permease [Yinghuangia sp. ASG 101]
MTSHLRVPGGTKTAPPGPGPLAKALAAAGHPVARRLLAVPLTVAGAALIIWSLLPLAPGDPARLTLVAQGVPEPTPEQLAQARADLGLDRSLPEQFGHWLVRAAHGDLGTSFASGRPVTHELAERLPATLRLGATAVLLALAIAVPTALVAAAFRRRWPDTAARGLALLGAATPGFVAGLILIQVVVLRGGFGSVVLDGSWGEVGLPALCLAFGLFDVWSRLLRGSLVDALDSDWAASVTARGASGRRLLLRHALPNALPPLIHAVAVGAGALWGGAAIVETVFTWPGAGSYVVTSVKARDLPVIQAFAVFATLAYVAVSLLADLLAAAVDPRLRGRAQGAR